MTILVTGATGQLGSKVAKKLNESGAQIRLLVRNKDKVTDFDNVEVFEGDYTDPASLRLAFKGVERAFIVSIHEPPMERAKLHRNTVERFLGRKPCSLSEFYSRNPSYIASLKRLPE